MSIFGQTKGTELEKQIAQIANCEAIGGAMYYALGMIAKEKFGLSDVAEEFIKLGNQETNHGAYYDSLNGKYPTDEKKFWNLIRGLSKAEYRGEFAIGGLAKKLEERGLTEAAEQVKIFAQQEKHHGEVTEAIIKIYAPNDDYNEGKPIYICPVCGFEYIGEIGEEGEDYKCPLCGVKKAAFKLK